MADDSEFQADRSALMAGAAAVMVALVFFLLVAQTALFGLAAPLAGGAPRVRLLMTVLALSGALGGGLAAWRFRLDRFPRTLSNLFRACGASAILGLLAGHPSVMVFTAMAVGGSLGALLVVLVAGLRASIGTKNLGTVIAIGVGLAYAVTSVPWLVDASPRTQVIVAAFIAISGALAGPFLPPQEPSVSVAPDYRWVGLTVWTAIFLTLVVLEGTLFLLLQSPGMVEPDDVVTGMGGWTLLLAHLGAAGAAARLLQHDGLSRTVLIAAGVLAAAGLILLLGRGGNPAIERFLHAFGATLTVTALLYFPALGGRAAVTAGLFAATLWLGSIVAAGVSQFRAELPWPAVVGAAGIILAALSVRRRWYRRGA